MGSPSRTLVSGSNPHKLGPGSGDVRLKKKRTGAENYADLGPGGRLHSLDLLFHWLESCGGHCQLVVDGIGEGAMG